MVAPRLPFLEVLEVLDRVLEFNEGRFEEAALVGVFLLLDFAAVFREVVGLLDAMFLDDFLLFDVLEGDFTPDFEPLVFFDVVGRFVPADLDVFLLELAAFDAGFLKAGLAPSGLELDVFPVGFFGNPAGLLDEELFGEGRLLVFVLVGPFFMPDLVVGLLEEEFDDFAFGDCLGPALLNLEEVCFLTSEACFADGFDEAFLLSVFGKSLESGLLALDAGGVLDIGGPEHEMLSSPLRLKQPPPSLLVDVPPSEGL